MEKENDPLKVLVKSHEEIVKLPPNIPVETKTGSGRGSHKMKEQKRCQYTPQGLKTFGQQKLGYAKEINRHGIITSYRVRWDNKKSWQTYHVDFIDVSPLLALFTDDQQAEALKAKEPEYTAREILAIDRNLEYIKKTGLSEKAIVILLKDYIGGQNINKRQIEAVLQALPKLKGQYLTPSVT